MIYRIIDKNTKEFLRDGATFDSETETGLNIYTTKAPNGIHKPIWDSTTETWSEGLTDEELATIEENKANALEKQTAITYLSSTNYVSNNYNDLLKVDSTMAEKYYNSVSDTYEVTVEEILKQRAEYIAYLNKF